MADRIDPKKEAKLQEMVAMYKVGMAAMKLDEPITRYEASEVVRDFIKFVELTGVPAGDFIDELMDDNEEAESDLLMFPARKEREM